MTARKIWLLRHAKADSSGATGKDHGRPLSNLGRRSAAQVATTLHRELIRPDVVLVSTARRAVETAEPLAVEVTLEPKLYNADADEVLQRLRALPDDVTSVLVVGHNPGMEDLAGQLGDENGMSTATLLAFDVDAATWAALRVEDARPTGRWQHPGKK